MSAPTLKVGDAAVHVERLFRSVPREILRVTIVRETPTQWIDSTGTAWRKRDGRSVQRLGCGNYERHLMTVADFDTERGAS